MVQVLIVEVAQRYYAFSFLGLKELGKLAGGDVSQLGARLVHGKLGLGLLGNLKIDRPGKDVLGVEA